MNIMIAAGLLITLITLAPVIFVIHRDHPRGLIILFLIEMWERFSFYGMRALLIFYLTQNFLFNQVEAIGRYGAFTALVYLLPLLGGIVADRWLGTRRSVALGAMLIVMGHGMIAFEPKAAQELLVVAGKFYSVSTSGQFEKRQSMVTIGGREFLLSPGKGGALTISGWPGSSDLPSVVSRPHYRISVLRDAGALRLFELALAFIVVGTGFLKPNVSAMVGQLYNGNNRVRDAGFALYYYGINLGAFWATILCGLVSQNYGWNAGFGLAGIGMALGLATFLLGKPLIAEIGDPPDPLALKSRMLWRLTRENLIYLGALAACFAVSTILPKQRLVGVALTASIACASVVLVFLVVRVCKTPAQRRSMGSAVLLILGAVVFFTLLEQAGSSLNLFAANNVDLDLGNVLGSALSTPNGTPAQIAEHGEAARSSGWINLRINASQMQSLNSGFVLLLAPLFGVLWRWLAKRKIEIGPLYKFGLGLAQIGLSFLALVAVSGMHDSAFRVPLIAIFILYFLQSTGELCLSPVGLSAISRLSLPKAASFMLAVWFLASSVAQYVGALIASLTATQTIGGRVADPHASFEAAIRVFSILGWVGLATGLVFLFLGRLIAAEERSDANA